MRDDTQYLKFYNLLKKAGNVGVYNYKFGSLGFPRYTHFAKVLRDEWGCHITATRMQYPNGRWTNIWVYRLEEDDE